jgi:ATP-dependent exoDNAse (exonuclease V) beta subunit
MSELVRQEMALSDADERRVLDTLLGGAITEKRYGRGPKEFETDKLLLAAPQTNKVRLMTVHASKGLEARFVILADPGAGAMTSFPGVVDRSAGPNVPLTNKIYEIDMLDLPQLAVAGQQEALLKEEEEKRVLYVAASRAIERFIVVQHEGEALGSFLAPLEDALTKATTRERLYLPESFAARHTMARPAPKLLASKHTAETWAAAQASAAAKLRPSSPVALAVTSAAKGEAERLFNTGRGSGGGRTMGLFLHGIMETICIRARAKLRTTPADLDQLCAAATQGILLPKKKLGKLRSAVTAFLSSKLYERILAASVVLPEVPFRDAKGLRGVIDLVFIDAEGAHVVDGKSDVFTDREREEKVVSLY